MTAKFICPSLRLRFVPQSPQHSHALAVLTGRTSVTLEQIHALRALGATIDAIEIRGKKTKSV